jgi:predicted acyltransferase
MQILMLCVLAALIASLLVLWQRARAQQRMLATLAQDQTALAAAWNALPADAAPLLKSAGTLISIEILNPVELASLESPLAGPLGRVAPSLIRKLVYQRAAEMLRQQLGEHGVQAEVRIHGLA